MHALSLSHTHTHAHTHLLQMEPASALVDASSLNDTVALLASRLYADLASSEKLADSLLRLARLCDVWPEFTSAVTSNLRSDTHALSPTQHVQT